MTEVPMQKCGFRHHNGTSCSNCKKLEEEAMPEMARLYPKYHKIVPAHWKTIDTYGIGILFPVDDPSGCIIHARKKLLVPGIRTGNKSLRQDVKEARDTLNRWLELHPET